MKHRTRLNEGGVMHQAKMLPRIFQSLAVFFVNAATKFGRIESDIDIGEPRFGL